MGATILTSGGLEPGLYVGELRPVQILEEGLTACGSGKGHALCACLPCEDEVSAA